MMGCAMSQLPEALKTRMQKQGYHFAGRHSAVKICEYTANGLRGGILCYKHAFYGIESWRCMQATPAIGCDLGCRFCWRIIPEEMGINWNELNAVEEWDDPEFIVEKMLDEQRRIVSGYRSMADTELKQQRWTEANTPKHVAISLTGEPTFYPKLSALIAAFHKRGISTFMVTNGTLPEAIARLDPLPTQLYISLQAPDAQSYDIVVRPKIKNAWERFTESLRMLSSIKTRTVLRMTLIKGLNMHNPEGYASLIGTAKPNYVEVKGFSFVGGSRNPERGLSIQSMPNHSEIKEFAGKLSSLTGYQYTAEHQPSRVVLLSRDEDSAKRRIIDFAAIR